MCAWITERHPIICFEVWAIDSLDHAEVLSSVVHDLLDSWNGMGVWGIKESQCSGCCRLFVSMEDRFLESYPLGAEIQVQAKRLCRRMPEPKPECWLWTLKARYLESIARQANCKPEKGVLAHDVVPVSKGKPIEMDNEVQIRRGKIEHWGEKPEPHTPTTLFQIKYFWESVNSLYGLWHTKGLQCRLQACSWSTDNKHIVGVYLCLTPLVPRDARVSMATH